MFKLILIYPYFGKFPNYFPLFIESAKKNDNVLFTFITDNIKIVKKFNKNKILNLKFVYMEFTDIQKRIKNVIDINATISNPYKLCDYKQFYSIIFSDYIKGFPMWGFGDLDVIFGNISNFIFNQQCDVYYRAGHLQIFRNVSEVNNLLDDIPTDEINRVFSSDKICFFDERQYSRFYLAKNHPSIKTYHSYHDFADIYPYSPMLLRNYNGEEHYDRQSLYEWIDGKLYVLYLDANNMIKKNEILYVHFRKRFLIVCLIRKKHFYMMGTKFVTHLTKKQIIKYLLKEKTKYGLFYRVYRRIFLALR